MIKIGLITVFSLLSAIAFGQDWLYFPTGIPKNWVNIGQLNVPGDSITVEALIALTDTTTNPEKDIVSKHVGVVDCNYLLRRWRFQVTTTSGYKEVDNTFKYCLDSIYHVAGTYDGDSIKYFVNGNEVASVQWTGTLFQNTHLAAIGSISDPFANEQFFGYIDELRIWNVARSQSEIINNMYNLPNPASQHGLLAYYKFNGNYINVQGNPAYNGIPIGSQLQDTINPYFRGTISNPPVNVSITITASDNPVCSGSSVIFTASPVNGGNSPIFQWKVNGTNIGSNSQTFTYSPLNGDMVTCELTSSLCTTNNPALSNVIIMTVIPELPVSISITGSQNPACSGTPVTFTAIPSNGGLTPFYLWRVNGINVGSDSSQFTYTPSNDDTVSCFLFSSLPCPMSYPALSNSIIMTVIPYFPVNVSITASQNPICPGRPVTFTATPANGGTSPSFQWKVNGLDKGTDSPQYTYVPSNNDAVSCMLTSNLTCATNNPATSNTVYVTIFPVTPVNLGPDTSICQGNTVTFNAGPCIGCLFSWSDLTTGQFNIGTGQTFTTGIAGVYNVEVTDSNGCWNGDTVQLSIHSVTPGITGNNNPCQDSISYFYQTEAGMSNYQWTISSGGTIISGLGTNQISVKWNSPGSQFVSVNYTTPEGCTASVATNFPIRVYPVPGQAGNISGPVQHCTGTADESYSVDTILFATTYSWQLPPGFQILDGMGTNIITVSIDTSIKTGDIYVYGRNLCGDGSLSPPFHFITQRSPVAEAGPDQVIPYDSATMLNGSISGGSGSYSWVWRPSALLTEDTLLDPETVKLTHDTLFILMVTDLLNGCLGTDSVRIKVLNNEINEACLVFHNVITPNGDGLNDKWIIDCIENFPDNNVIIFNRWGDIVNRFDHYDNFSKVWQGTRQDGRPLPDGTYYYVLTIKNGGNYCGWIFLRGIEY